MEKKLSKGMLMAALICGSVVPVLLGGASVYAAEAEDDALSSFTLDPVVITATRTEKRDVDVPASTEILTNEDLIKRGATNAMDAMRQVNGIEVNNYFPGGTAMTTMTSDINIRGYGDYTLVMINGNPVNLNGVYNIDAIPREAIERIEIVKGGGAILYGSDAVGGVVNIITKKKYSNYITAGYGNYGQRKLNVGAGNEKFHVNYDLYRWGEVNHLSDSANPPTASSYTYSQNKSKKENIGVGYNINDKLSFEYNHFNSAIDYHRNSNKTGKYHQYRTTETNQDLAQLNYNDKDFKGHIWYNKNRIKYSGFNAIKINKVLGPVALTKRENTVFGVDLQKDFHFGEKSLLTVGTDYKYEKFDQVLTTGVVPDDHVKTRNTYALFAQLDQKLTKQDNIIVGGRGTWTKGAWNNQNYHDFSASGQYIHKFDEDQSLYVKAAQSFVMPTFSQMYPSGMLGGEPNPDLEPQKGVHYELGYKKVAGNHTWSAALFHMKVKNNISATRDTDDEGNTIYQYQNKDFRNTGFEANLRVEANDRLGYNIGMTIQNPENINHQNEKKVGWQRKFGKYQIKGGIDYSIGKFRSALNGTYIWDRYTSPSNTDSYAIKPYFLTTFTAIYAPDKNSEISLIVDNVLDRKDILSNTASAGGGYYATPTNFMLSYTYKF
ncbi:MAG: TonB-dependent receptor [Acidaminococcaceae bacterium]|nr:TonB-dependent receptor [Acidaminococcaceae bacterium]